METVIRRNEKGKSLKDKTGIVTDRWSRRDREEKTKKMEGRKEQG